MTFLNPNTFSLTSAQAQHSLAVVQALQQKQAELHCIASPELQALGSARIDFAAGDPATHSLNISEPEIVQPFIQQTLQERNLGFLYGGYNTERVTYHSDLFAPTTEPRNIHLAFDIWLPPETPLHSPMPATVFSVHNNNYHLDYGPTVILQHELNGLTFWSLYGHLQTRTLEHIRVGQTLKVGEQFAWVGYSHENIGWTPHVHAQIITDLLGNTVDFPGLCSKSTREFYTTICPDAGYLFRF